MSFEINLNDVYRGIDFADQRFRAAAERGMQKAMEELKADAQAGAPNLTGELRQRAHVRVSVSGYSVTGEVSFSLLKKNKRGWATDVALFLHEHRKFKEPSTPGTGPKYLERPLKAKSARYREIIAQEIAKELRG
ncbi:HK97 gp10 family phage protein [Paenibacillus sp. OV219]|uniref:HK97 gp10 family phage protein n=1 Tax=Paenibacillus sp. OV219 TaxID=1884377 RepID=UPI0008B49F4B|nr:HK97 gp10 family phage protein [Paenibacillus sp. OV219]SEM81678.1 hypothetical protein SAMN05518847_101878 [Paenibacillus sp. OV219]